MIRFGDELGMVVSDREGCQVGRRKFAWECGNVHISCRRVFRAGMDFTMIAEI